MQKSQMGFYLWHLKWSPEHYQEWYLCTAKYGPERKRERETVTKQMVTAE